MTQRLFELIATHLQFDPHDQTLPVLHRVAELVQENQADLSESLYEMDR